MSKSKLYPSPERLLKIADAADKVARALRYNWPLWDASFKENPYQATFPENLDVRNNRSHFDQLGRHTVEVADATGALRDNLADVTPADHFAGLEGPGVEGLLKAHPPVPPTETTVTGWSHEVNVALTKLSEIPETVKNAMTPERYNGPMEPIPLKTVEQVEACATILRNEVAEKQGAKEPGDTQAQGLEDIPLSHQKAYYSFLYAQGKAGKRLEDREAYGILKEHGIDSSSGDAGDLEDYKLPSFETWSRYLREARKATGEQKYTPRHARLTGRSIVHGDEVDHQHGTDD